MRLSDLLTTQPWAITPEVLDSLCEAYNRLAVPGANGETASSALPPSQRESGGSLYELCGRVALIEVTGVIHRRAGSAFCFGWSGQDEIRASLDQAALDPDAGAILLSFDSPGGVAAGVKELADHIAAVAKPVYAYADGLCASAAYWLASATGRVYAPATATVGSIGVLQVHCDNSVANTAAGRRYTYITGGTWKASGHSDAPLSGADQAYLQGMVDGLHKIFRDDVAAKVDVDAAKPEAWGDGQVFLAAEALKLGLICGIVSDRETLIAQINEETSMDKAKLASEYPALMAEIKTEAKAEAETMLAAALENQLALVKMVAGEEAVEKVANLTKAGLTAEQVAALGSLGFQPAQSGEDKEANSRADILAAIVASTPAPLPAAAQVKVGGDAIAAAIDRIGSIS